MNKIKSIFCLFLLLCFVGSTSILAENGNDIKREQVELKSMVATKYKMPLLTANSCDPKIFIPGNPNIDPKILIKLRDR